MSECLKSLHDPILRLFLYEKVFTKVKGGTSLSFGFDFLRGNLRRGPTALDVIVCGLCHTDNLRTRPTDEHLVTHPVLRPVTRRFPVWYDTGDPST